jgi:hypothetical protein
MRLEASKQAHVAAATVSGCNSRNHPQESGICRGICSRGALYVNNDEYKYHPQLLITHACFTCRQVPLAQVTTAAGVTQLLGGTNSNFREVARASRPLTYRCCCWLCAVYVPMTSVHLGRGVGQLRHPLAHAHATQRLGCVCCGTSLQHTMCGSVMVSLHSLGVG